MNFSEKDLELLILNDLKKSRGKNLIEKGLNFSFSNESDYCGYEPKILWFNQLNIDNYGIIDIVGFYRSKGNIYIELIELKSRNIKSEDFDQILRYRTGLEILIKSKFKKANYFFSLTLIGTGFDNGHFIHRNIGAGENFNVCEFSFDLNGIYFKESFGDWIKNVNREIIEKINLN